MEALSQATIGRILQALHPEMVQELLREYRPLATDQKLIPEIYLVMNAIYPNMDEHDQKVMFVALVYRVFRPHSFLPPLKEDEKKSRSAAGKLPAGVRDKIAACLGFRNPEMASHYKTFAEANIKNPRYRAKMKLVLDELGLTEPEK